MTEPLLPTISEVRLTNFKSTLEERVELRPLTVVIGANSAGKSSLLQALLLLAQAVQDPSPRPVFPLNGALIDLGFFNQVKNHQSPSSARVGIGISVNTIDRRRYWDRRRRQPAGELNQLSLDVEFKGKDKADPASSTIHRLRFETDSQDGESVQVDLRRTDAASEADLHEMAAHMRFRPGGELTEDLRGKLRIYGRTERVVAVDLHGIVPMDVTIRRPHRDVLIDSLIGQMEDDLEERGIGIAEVPPSRRTMDAEEADLFDRFSRRSEEVLRGRMNDTDQPEQRGSLIGEVFDRIGGTPSPSSREFLYSRTSHTRRHLARSLDEGRPIGLSGMTSGFHDTVWGFGYSAQAVLGTLRHLGGLRAAPLPLYPTSKRAQQGDLGPDGRYAAAVYYARKDQEVSFFDANGHVSRKTLKEAISVWAEPLGLFSAVDAHHQAALGIDIAVRQPGLDRDVDITAVGLGVSQFFPVLLRCLLSEPGEVVLLEQPELHLHPRSQQRLADFLLACSLSGRQLIVETHSEHIVNRLRRHAADAADDRVANSVGLVFAVRDASTGVTSYESVGLNPYGGLTHWPDGFMDEGISDARAILEAGVAKLTGDDQT